MGDGEKSANGVIEKVYVFDAKAWRRYLCKGRIAYEPSAAGGGAGFYMFVVPAVIAAGYIAWLKKKALTK